MKKRDVLGLGCATIDELITVENYPPAESKIPIQKTETQGGGLTATALVAAARIGASCAYAGQLGHDETSQKVARILGNEGVDTSLIAWRDDAAAIRSLIIVDTTHQTRTIFFHRAGAVGAALNAPDESEIEASRVLLIDHYGGLGNVRACEIANKHKIPIVADFERTNVENFAQFFPLVDHLIVSQNFAQKLTGETNPEKMARSLWNSKRAVVIVTMGENGCWSVENDVLSHHAAFEVPIVDTTGCGDCFHGIYAATLAWNWPLQTRIQWASAAAALKAGVAGAQKGLPNRAQIHGFLNF